MLKSQHDILDGPRKVIKFANFFDSVIEYYKDLITKSASERAPMLFLMKGNEIKIFPLLMKSLSPTEYIIPIIDSEQPEAYIYCGLGKATNPECDTSDDTLRLIIWGKTLDGKLERKYCYKVKLDQDGKIHSFEQSGSGQDMRSNNFP